MLHHQPRAPLRSLAARQPTHHLLALAAWVARQLLAVEARVGPNLQLGPQELAIQRRQRTYLARHFAGPQLRRSRVLLTLDLERHATDESQAAREFLRAVEETQLLVSMGRVELNGEDAGPPTALGVVAWVSALAPSERRLRAFSKREPGRLNQPRTPRAILTRAGLVFPRGVNGGRRHH